MVIDYFSAFYDRERTIRLKLRAMPEWADRLPDPNTGDLKKTIAPALLTMDLQELRKLFPPVRAELLSGEVVSRYASDTRQSEFDVYRELVENDSHIRLRQSVLLPAQALAEKTCERLGLLPPITMRWPAQEIPSLVQTLSLWLTEECGRWKEAKDRYDEKRHADEARRPGAVVQALGSIWLLLTYPVTLWAAWPVVLNSALFGFAIPGRLPIIFRIGMSGLALLPLLLLLVPPAAALSAAGGASNANNMNRVRDAGIAVGFALLWVLEIAVIVPLALVIQGDIYEVFADVSSRYR